MPIPTREESEAALERNHAAFERMRLDLCVGHEGEYVLLAQERVQGFYPTEEEAIVASARQLGFGPAYIGHVTREPEVLFLPTLFVQEEDA